MQDRDKSKEQLIYELTEMRERLTAMEATEARLVGMEKSLRESEERFRLLYENAPLGYQSLDENGYFLEVNQAWLDTLGYDREEVIGRWFGDFLAPGYREHFKVNFPKFKAAGEIHWVEFEMLRKDGSQISVAFDGKIGRDEQGRFRQTHCILHDISEIRRSQEALEESEKRYRAVVDNIGVGISLLNRKMEIVEVNKAFKKYFLHVSPACGQICYEQYNDPPRSEPCSCCPCALTLQDGEVHEAITETPAGSEIRHYRLVSSPIKDSGGNVQYVIELTDDITDRKTAEDALDRANQEWERTFNAISDGIMVLDDQHKIVRANKAMASALGMPQQDLIGKHCFELVHGEKEPPVFCPHSKLIADGQEHRAEVTEPRLGATLNVRVSPIFDQNGQVRGSVHVTRDISERKQVEVELRQSRDLLRAIIEAAPTAIIGLDLDGNVQMVWNPAAEKMLGWSAQEVMGHPLPSVPEESQEEFRGFRERIRSGKTLDGVEVRRMKRDGSPIDYSIYAAALHDAEGRICGNIAVLVDVTERKLNEKALRESEELHRITIGNITDTVLITDDTGAFTYVCPNTHVIFGYSPEEVWALGNVTRLIGNNLFDDSELEYREEISNIETTIIDKAGQGHTLLVNVRRVDIKGGTVLYTCRDITERKRAEEALWESEKRVRRKLDAILSPEGDIEALELSDIIDGERIQKLMDEFYRLTNVGIGIIDLHGNVLVGTGWQDICTKFHRANPESCQLCIESDLELSRDVPVGTFKQYRCRNNMWDIATPIMLNDKHVGNIFLGQFLFDDEIPEYEIFRQQAERYGFPEKEYLAALDRVPRWSHEKVDAAMSFYAAFAEMVGNLSYGNIKLANALEERKRAEDALQEASSYNRSLIEASLDPLVTISADGRITDVNTATEKVTGCLRQELIGSDFAYYFTDPEKARAGCQQAFKVGSVSDYQLDIRHRNGKLTPVMYNASVYRDRSGKGVGLFAAARDITERRRAERIADEQIRFQQILMDAIPIPVFFKDRHGKYLGCNEAFSNFLGRSETEIKGKSVFDLSPKHLADTYHIHDLELLNRGGIQVYESRVRYADATEHDVVFYKSTFPDVDGTVGGLIGVILDMTKQKQSEEALRESEAFYRSLYENISDCIFIIDVTPEGRFKFVSFNPAEERAVGMTTEQVANRFTDDLVSKEVAEQINSRYRTCVAERQTMHYEEVLDLPKGKTSFLTSLVPIEGPDGRINRIIGVARDITEEKSLQRQLLQAQKMEAVGTLAGGIAHDFNNILQVVVGFSEILLLDTKIGDREQEDIRKILSAARKGADLVKGLLAFSRKGEINPRPLNLNQVIHQTESILARTLPKSIKVVLILQEQLSAISADPVQIEQTLLNLAVNARDAMPDGGTLTFETASVSLSETYSKEHLDVEPGDYVLLTVSDTGEGMTKQTLEQIFEPFFSTKRTGEGTGLGLAMVYGIVKRHSGHITCYSEPGVGTTFKLYFPVLEMKAETPVREEFVRLPGGTETVLLVDDEDLLRELGTRTLSRAGYTVLAAANGREALQLYERERERISLVILDLIMPEMDGKQCLRELLKINPAIRVVLTSGYSANGPTKEVLEDGVRGFVSKPFDIGQLLQTVRKVLDETK